MPSLDLYYMTHKYNLRRLRKALEEIPGNPNNGKSRGDLKAFA
jgi:hypothetical protein